MRFAPSDTAQRAPDIHTPQPFLKTVQNTRTLGNSTRNTVHGTQRTEHSTRNTVHGKQDTENSTRKTVHGKQYTEQSARDTVLRRALGAVRHRSKRVNTLSGNALMHSLRTH